MYLRLERYSRPDSIAGCLRLLAEPDQQAALISGGSELNASARHTSLTHVIDIQALPLDHIEVEGAELRLGARVTLSQLRRHPALQQPALAALREAAEAYAVVALQNRSTLGGRVLIERCDQDVAVALAALGAKLKLSRLSGDEVVEEVIDYPLGAGARQQLDGALVQEVHIEISGGASALRRFGRTAVDVPLACCAAARHAGGVRLTAGLQGPDAGDLRRLDATETLLASWGDALPSGWQQLARTSLLGELADWGDAWASGAYRRDLSATMAVRALAAVVQPGASDEEVVR